MRTTVRSPKTAERISPATDSGATRASRPERSRSVTHTTSYADSAAIRSATSKTSLTAAAAWRCSGVGFSVPVVSPETAARAAARTRCTAATKADDGSSTRSSGDSSSATRRSSAASSSSRAVSSVRKVSARLPTRSTCWGLSSPDAAPVTRATSSCASSTTTARCSGTAVPPCMASMASRAWLVTTRLAERARSRDSSTRHESPCGHRWAPRHSRAGTDTWCHARSLWGGASSRSATPPVDAWSSAHSRSASTSVPSAESAVGVVRAVAARSPAEISVPWSEVPPSRTRSRQA